ncbi:MAG: helix-turn-helix transcriptional regulator [Bacilli bacterium]|nr:helix-turn-helix transcriptional regulator [Bacilli bacterium]
MNQEKIGKFILKLRKEKNMSQLDLADKIGVTDRAISKWENGKGLPDISLMQPLCKELNITNK